MSQSNIYYGLGVPTSSIYIPSLLNLTTSLTGSGRVAAGIADTFIGIPEYRSSSSFVPFKDNDQFASDGKSQGASFFSTGSNIENFTTPLWSKNKIEIPLNVSSDSTIKIRRDINYNSYQMGYFNFANRTWEGIGVGYDVKLLTDQACPDRLTLITHSCAGFATSLMVPRDSPWHIRGMGEVIQSFGFPYATKYHATSSQLLSLKNIIDKPFFVEKFVLFVSATFAGSATSISETITRNALEENNTNLFPIAANTFFIMNQRSKQNFSKPSFGASVTTFVTTFSPTSSQISKNGPDVYVDTIRDIIGF